MGREREREGGDAEEEAMLIMGEDRRDLAGAGGARSCGFVNR